MRYAARLNSFMPIFETRVRNGLDAFIRRMKSNKKICDNLVLGKYPVCKKKKIQRDDFPWISKPLNVFDIIQRKHCEGIETEFVMSVKRAECTLAPYIEVLPTKNSQIKHET